jgi:Lrp/AsnC family leucine-responsive transcriptional regulator
MRHYQDFVLNKLGVLESIGQIQSDFVMGVLKETHALPISDD